MAILRNYSNDIHVYINANKHSFMGYGSEFRPIQVIEPLILHHRSWPSFANQLQQGSKWPLASISESDRLAKNIEFIKRGNHKSAVTHYSVLHDIIQKEVTQGWMIPIPLTSINSIPNSEIAPVGIDNKQFKVLPDGTKTPKYRLTHDQSFEASIGQSVNYRTQRDKLDPLFYGGCLSRILHYIVSLRIRHPTTKILVGKSDFKSAYRRMNLHGETAARSIIMCKQFGLLSLRLTFGGSPCSNEWCTFAELCTDLANDILHCHDWDPSLLSSPHQIKLPPTQYLDDSIPFAPAAELDVDLPNDDMGRIDDFIDDGIAIVPDISNNKLRGVSAMLLAIHTLCRPLDPNEHIFREDCLSLEKLSEEGVMSECLTILGWKINTRSLTLALPNKKFSTWNQDLYQVISSKRASLQKLETIIGRLNHAATACPIMRYFLNRLRHVLEKWKCDSKPKHIESFLPKSSILDLQLWAEHFLPKINQGISLNIITYRRPTEICWSDACPKGLGGYNHHGLAWRWEIPEKYKSRVSNKNNLLEFLASLITVWLTIESGLETHFPCFLALGDNSSAVGWLHKANIDADNNKPLHLAARKYAQLLMQNDCCLYSQHIKGVHNNVADALSRLHNYSPSQLQNYILSQYPSQVPATFHIAPLPHEISSWMISLLQKIKEPTGSLKEPRIKKTEFGNVGVSTAESLTTNMTSSSKTYLPNLEPDCLEPLQPPSEDASFLNRTKDLWLQAQWKRPWQNWVRSLGQTWGTTPPMATRTEGSIPALQDNSEA
jgi:hypothetical protein